MIHERDHWGASLPDFDFTVEFDTIPLTVTGVCSPEYDARWHTRRVGVDYKSPITITVPIKLSITVVIEKAITITIIRLRLRLQLLVYHGNDSRLFIRHVHLQYYHA